MSRSRSPLIDVADLARRRDEVTLLDVRWRLGGPPGGAEYRRGHVPGAAYVDLETALAGPPGQGGRHPLPEPERFVAAMRRAGVRRDRAVVVYDDWSGLAAARCWWLLRHYGQRDVRLLDGGWQAWCGSGGAVATGESATEPGDFDGEPGAMATVDALTVAGVAVLVDARAPERFRGEQEPVDPVAGHIPGAINLPATDNLAPDGRFLAVDGLRARFAAAGVRPATDVAAYCGSGVTAAHQVLALEIAGVTAALYAESWSGWISDPSRPVATGP